MAIYCIIHLHYFSPICTICLVLFLIILVREGVPEKKCRQVGVKEDGQFARDYVISVLDVDVAVCMCIHAQQT